MAFLGQIKLFAGNFAPRAGNGTWAFCRGQVMAISQNTALFAILGTTYGGNGQTTFALPDLRGRVPVGQGQGPGLSSVSLGEQAGEQAHTLLSTEMPAHTHTIGVNSGAGNSADPTGRLLAQAPLGLGNTYGPTANAALSPNALTAAGGSQPHENRQPYLGLNYIICVQGTFPSRN